MQEKETIMVIWFELKISSLWIFVRRDLASFVMPKNYPRDGTADRTTNYMFLAVTEAEGEVGYP